jgi:hypothetical protein
MKALAIALVSYHFSIAVCRPKAAQSDERERLGADADRLSASGWSWGCVSAIDSNGRTIWIADAHRDDRKRFVVRADEILTAFLELELAIRPCGDCKPAPQPVLNNQ